MSTEKCPGHSSPLLWMPNGTLLEISQSRSRIRLLPTRRGQTQGSHRHVLMPRVPDLQLAEPHESSETPSERETRGDTPQAPGKPWWKKLFG
jgi:hypothetical protein